MTETASSTRGLEPVDLDAPDAKPLRRALGRFATGVTVVTAAGPSGVSAVTANSFSSVSLSPPLVLWSLARSSSRYPAFRAATRFGVHVLSLEQADIAAAFARSADALDDIDWSRSDSGAALFGGCLARFDCALWARYAGGDHDIFVLEVMSAEADLSGAPLLYFGGAFGALAPDA